MKKSRLTDEQIVLALRQAEDGTQFRETCRKVGVAEVRRLKQLEEENRRLKQPVADLSLDTHILQDALTGKLQGLIVAARW